MTVMSIRVRSVTSFGIAGGLGRFSAIIGFNHQFG